MRRQAKMVSWSQGAQAAALVLAVAAYVYLLLVPGNVTVVTVSDSAGGALTRQEQRTLVDVGGARVALALAVPVAFAALPFVMRRRGAAIVSACLLGTFSVLGLASVGLLFVPSGVAMAIAALIWPRQARPSGAA